MQTITLNKANTKFRQIVNDTLKNQNETLIVSDNGSVILMDYEYWEGIVETLNLLKDKESLNALVEGHSLRNDGKNTGKLINEAFYDL